MMACAPGRAAHSEDQTYREREERWWGARATQRQAPCRSPRRGILNGHMRLRSARGIRALPRLTGRGTPCSITGRLDKAPYPRHNPVTPSEGLVMSVPHEPVPSYPGVVSVEAPAGAG